MNKIVREHYPVANLPEDLREGLERDATVKIVVEVEERRKRDDLGMAERKPIPAKDLMELRRRLLSDGRPSVSTEEAVARIRELRDEWDY